MHPGSKLLWAKDAAGEIGKRPEPFVWEMDGERYEQIQRALADDAAVQRRGRK